MDAAMSGRTDRVEVEGGAVPVHVIGPDDPSSVPGLVVVPSIFGPAPDLLRRVSEFAGAALVVVADPFWRVGGGAVPYGDHAGAIARLKGFDRDGCFAEMRAVIEWTRARCNGRVAGLGVCFGGPVVLVAAAAGALDGVVTWHGSRMANYLEGVERITGPVCFHFGADDPVSPPDAIEAIQAAFANHPDASIVVHPGLEHGFSHDGPSYDAIAAQACVDDTRALLASLSP
jgi:carboxymethylenebutenolidase